MADTELLRSDAELDGDIGFSRPLSEHWRVPRAILLTGATGFLGAYLLDELLRETEADIFCLLRAADPAAAATRLHSHLRDYGLWREHLAGRIIPVVGDLSRPRLGLAEPDYQRLAREIDLIFHNGAWINAVLSYADLKPANVEGTREILRFAGTGHTKPVHYSSTLAIFLSRAHARREVLETTLPILDENLQGGYKQSKWVAEQLLRTAQARGLPAVIHRPGRILGHSRTGHNGNLRDIFCTLLKACVRLGKYPQQETGIDITPVDYVSRAMVGLARREDVFGRTFHLCNPEPVAWNTLMAGIGRLGYPLTGVHPAEWREEIERQAAQFPREPFYRQLKLLLRAPIRIFAEDKPLISTASTRQALGDGVCPAVDDALLANYGAYFQRCGHLPPPPGAPAPSASIPSRKSGGFEILTPEVMAGQMDRVLTAAAGLPPDRRQALAEGIAAFDRQWRRCYDRFGQDSAGELSYRDLLLELEERILPFRPWFGEGQGEPVQAVLEPLLQLTDPALPRPYAPKLRLKPGARADDHEAEPPELVQPLFIISAPRSGSTLLFETLAGFPDLWTVGDESHALIEGLPELHPAARGYASNRLTAAEATPAIAAALRLRFARSLRNRAGQAPAELPKAQRPARVRLLEKTPKNILRIPFLRAVFPDARFLVLYRAPEETLASMLEGWRTRRRFVAYQPLPGWPHRNWRFLLVPGWEALSDRPLADIVAHQWRMAHEVLLGDLEELPAGTWKLLRYADLVREPRPILRRIARFAELDWDGRVEEDLAGGLPLSGMTLSAPEPEKWRRQAAAIERVLPGLRPLVGRLEALTEPVAEDRDGTQGAYQYPIREEGRSTMISLKP